MSEEFIEDTEENPEKEVSADDIQETPQPEEKETPIKQTDSPEQYSEREKRYYARMKQAENEAKKWRSEAEKAKKPVSEVDAILEVQEATKGLDTSEVTELRLRADALKTTLTEARKSEGFALWQRGYKEKVEKENPPLPSTTQGNVKEGKSLKEMTIDERTELFKKIGLVSERAIPRPPAK